MSGKRQKLPTKRGQTSEGPTPNFDVSKFVKEGAADRFGTICKNRSFIKENGFHHPDDFFRKTIADLASSSCDECGARILRQPRLPHRQEGPGTGCVGRLQRGVYQPLL